MSISEGVPAPTGSSLPAVYQHQVQMTAYLRRTLASVGSGAGSTDHEDRITALETTAGDLQTRLTDLEDIVAGLGTPGSALTPEEDWLLRLVSQVRTVIGSPAEMQWRVLTNQEQDAQAAMFAAINAHHGRTGIFQEQTVRTSETEALAQDIKIISAYLGGSGATVTDFSTAVANGDQSLAYRMLQAETEVANNTSSAQILLESVDGIQSRVALRVNRQNQAIGYALLDGTPLGSTFTVVSDKFVVASPEDPNTTKNIFVIGPINDQKAIALNADLYTDNSIFARHIEAGAIKAYHITAGSITAAKIAAGAVTADAIEANAVTADKIAAGAITAEKIVAGSVDQTLLADGSVLAAKIASGAVDTAAIAASAITTAKIDDAAIIASKIAAGQVVATHIAAGQVNASHIAVNSVDATKINVTTLTSITAAFGNASCTGTLTGGPSGKLELDFTLGRIRAVA